MVMQLKRIKIGHWYQTTDGGAGKCLAIGAREVKLQIDGKAVWLSPTDVRFEIARGQEPHVEEDRDRPEAVEKKGVLEALGRSSSAQGCRSGAPGEIALGSASPGESGHPDYPRFAEESARGDWQGGTPMKILNKKLRQEFARSGCCEWCNRWCVKREGHHVRTRTPEITIRINLFSVGSTRLRCCSCHTDIGNGKIPRREVLKRVAIREKVRPEDITA